jgi:hypothetical protein
MNTVLEPLERRSSTALNGALLLLAALLSLWLLPLPCADAALPTTTHAWWHLESSPAPTNLQPGGEGEIVLRAVDLGDAAVDGAAGTVTIADVLPASLRASVSAISGQVTGSRDGTHPGGTHPGAMACSLASLSCTFSEALEPYEQLEVKITMHEVALAAHAGENEMTVTGGGAPPASLRKSIAVSSVPTQFGIENYELTPENETGSIDTQAGSHPFQLTTTIALDRTVGLGETSGVKELLPEESGLVKNLSFKWPPGLIGNPTVFPRCTALQFTAIVLSSADQCPADTAVGVALVTFREPIVLRYATEEVPVFNLEPEVGEPARFGFEVDGGIVVIDTSIRTGEDYGVTVSVDNITQVVGTLSSVVTVWGVPGDPRHDESRGWACLRPEKVTSGCVPLGQSAPPPFLSLPTSCSGSLQTAVEADSWQEPNNTFKVASSEPMPALDGCNALQFSPEIKVTPDGTQASEPSGLGVDVHVPQEGQLNPAGLAQSNVKDIKVTLPEGVTLNPAGANGLEACSEGLVGYLPGESSPPSELHFTPSLPGSPAALAVGDDELLEPGTNFCPNAAKVGTVKITTPLLPNSLEGAVYLAAQNANPFGSLVAMYIVAEDPVSGSLVKLPGQVTLNQSTGQIESTFENTPQLAFEDAELHFFGGETAPLSTPAHCGIYTTQATFTPWSGTAPVAANSSFQITSGPGGASCPPSSLPFAPTLNAGTTNIQAGAFSALDTTIGREDGNQNLHSVTLHMPNGVTGLLADVKLCGEPQANAGTCGPESLIGHTTVSVGLGGDPFTVTGGEVFITGPYNGQGPCTVGSQGCAPFGLSIVNPAVAGPFNLGKVVVRGKIEVDPHTAALTIVTAGSGPYAIPTILDGIPLQIKHVAVTIDRPGFTINPTSCDPMAITGTMSSAEGASAPLEVPFQVANCANLKFVPKFAVSTAGQTSKVDGASLTARLTEPSTAQGTEANITMVKVDLPKQLPSRLTTLQKACTNAQFEANPAGCPAASKIGYATVTTPLLPVPLEGPAIFVSHGGEAFPSLTMVLQGYGLTVDLVGTTFISRAGITSTTFKTVPDTPFNAFALTLPEGPYSALAAHVSAQAKYSLCGQKLTMPTALVGQNGAEIHESTPVSVTGCAKAELPTRAQKLAKALKACGKQHKAKRKSCEGAARRKYGRANKERKGKKQ